MTTNGDSLASATQEAALDDNAAPDTGLEPDTAPDAAGEQDVSASADVDPAATAAGSDEGEQQPDDGAVVLDGPAAENDEMRRGTSDLQSSQEKSAEAREIFTDLQGKTQPEATES